MVSDRRLFQKNPQTKRQNVVSLSRSGAFGRVKSIDKAFTGGEIPCHCRNGVGCSQVTNIYVPTPCDIVVYPNSIVEN